MDPCAMAEPSPEIRSRHKADVVTADEARDFFTAGAEDADLFDILREIHRKSV